jgi:hypothetical protein
MTMDMVHCIYCSAAAGPGFSTTELEALLEVSRWNNSRLGITGILLYHGRSFFQVLEGERAVVEALYERIAADKRHSRVTKLILEPIEERDFPDWTMGYPKISQEELSEIPGLNDFFGRGRSYTELGQGRAKTLLEAFKDGRWRASLL